MFTFHLYKLQLLRKFNEASGIYTLFMCFPPAKMGTNYVPTIVFTFDKRKIT